MKIATPIDEARLHELGLVLYVTADSAEVSVRLAGQHPLVVFKTAARVPGGWIAASRHTPPKTGWHARLPAVNGGIPQHVVADDPEGLVALGVAVHADCADALGGWDEIEWFAGTMRTGLEAVALERAARHW